MAIDSTPQCSLGYLQRFNCVNVEYYTVMQYQNKEVVDDFRITHGTFARNKTYKAKSSL